MNNLEKVNDFLTQSQVFYLTTLEGDKPKCRPISFHMVDGGKLYFGVGDFKDVYRQLITNPNTEFCATLGNDFLRFYGKAVFTKSTELSNKAFEILPMLRDIYNEKTGYELCIFSLENATAEFRSMMGLIEKIKF